VNGPFELFNRSYGLQVSVLNLKHRFCLFPHTIYIYKHYQSREHAEKHKNINFYCNKISKARFSDRVCVYATLGTAVVPDCIQKRQLGGV